MSVTRWKIATGFLARTTVASLLRPTSPNGVITTASKGTQVANSVMSRDMGWPTTLKPTATEGEVLAKVVTTSETVALNDLCKALGKIGTDRSIPVLQELLSKPEVAKSAIEAIGEGLLEQA